MEKNGNIYQEGYTTVESSIVVPIVFIIIALFLLILLAMFKYTNGVIHAHEQNLMMEESDHINVSFSFAGYQVKKSYQLSEEKMSVQTLQRLIEFLITLLEDYNERLKIYEDEP